MISKKFLYPALGSAGLLLLFGGLNVLIPNFFDLEAKWLIIAAVPLFIGIIQSGLIRKLKVGGIEYESNLIIEADTSKKNLSSGTLQELDLGEDKPLNVLPADYIYLNHTSFLRLEKQKEFQTRPGAMNIPYYDIRVNVNSYYRGALERIKYVVYFLHESYDIPIQARTNREDHFELKELAYGEYVLTAQVFLKDAKKPIILERYITLWNSGPIISKHKE